jgi:thiosulfate reductase cytochrome b subunit
MRTLVQDSIIGYVTVIPLLLSLMVLQGIHVLAGANQLRRVRWWLGASSVALLMIFIAVVLARFVLLL